MGKASRSRACADSHTAAAACTQLLLHAGSLPAHPPALLGAPRCGRRLSCSRWRAHLGPGNQSGPAAEGTAGQLSGGRRLEASARRSGAAAPHPARMPCAPTAGLASPLSPASQSQRGMESSSLSLSLSLYLAFQAPCGQQRQVWAAAAAAAAAAGGDGGRGCPPGPNHPRGRPSDACLGRTARLLRLRSSTLHSG